MATLPNATTAVSSTAGAVAGGQDLLCLIFPCATSDDITPRLFGSAAALFAQHGYCEGVEYMAIHAEETGKPVLAIGLPIDTPGTVGREDTSGNTGTSSTTVSAGGDGVLAEHDGVLRVPTGGGGTVGTDQIKLELSLDGGRKFKKIRLGTATSYTIPYFGVSVSFSVGTLVAGDTIHTWHGTAPLSDSDDWADARAALAAQKKGFRSILLCGDLQSDDEASAFNTQLNAYETEDKRFVFGRASVYDREPQAALSVSTHRMTGSPSLTFAEVGGTGDTITRATGSWLADGFAVGDTITITGATASAGANNITAVIASLSATVITLGSEDLAAEVSANCTVVGSATLTFANSGETITRNRGSWLDDGFRVGATVTVDGSDSGTNDGTFTVTAVTALVLTLAAGAVDADEVSPVTQVTITAGQTKAAWMAEIDAEFDSIDDAPRISLASGRARKLSPFSGWFMRRSAAWAASVREYQHDLQRTTWRKDDGPLDGWSLEDADGNLAEWDDRVDGAAASAARFTAFRTWGNGPDGAFIALSLTRAVESSPLAQTSNEAVTNLACSTVQLNTELAVGQDLDLNDDGTATSASLSTIQKRVNDALELALFQNRGEGTRCSKAVWTPSKDDKLNVPEALLTGVLELVLKGIVHSVRTDVRVS